MIADHLCEALQDAMASVGSEPGPLWKCAPRGGHRRIDFRCAAGAYVGEMFSVDR